MVKKYLSWLIALLFLLIIVWQASVISQKNKKIEQQAQDIAASFQYIKQLTNRIEAQESDKERSEDLRSVLQSYLQEQKENSGLKKPKVTADELQLELQKYRRKRSLIPDRIPIEGEFAISQKFKSKHPAWDFAAPIGTSVKAAAAGVVSGVYEDKYLGKTVEIDHLNGFKTRYAHLAKVLVPNKRFVEKGETIALVGNTGNSSAPHLHFEIENENRPVDPDSLLIR